MSSNIPICDTCGTARLYDRHAPVAAGEESTYGVAWRCPNGHGLMLDICPVGPLVPSRGVCLNCGGRIEEEPRNAVCQACGLSRVDCESALGINELSSSFLETARAAFALGLFRRGLAVLNWALIDNAQSLEAWHLKSRFLHSIGFHRTASQMIGSALAVVRGESDRVALFEEQAFLLAEAGDGGASLRSANAAVALGSASVRTLYLRGRALALIGRLEEARTEMQQVLSLDPENVDARRGQQMIDATLAGTRRKWWLFWKR